MLVRKPVTPLSRIPKEALYQLREGICLIAPLDGGVMRDGGGVIDEITGDHANSFSKLIKRFFGYFQ
jgi:hypothetical protein